MPSIPDFQIQIGTDVSEQSLSVARARAREAAVIALQQAGDLSIREAAQELGLSYQGYLQLLNRLALPVSPVDASSDLDSIRARLGL